jgi:iron complex transport system permease protein
VSTPSCHPIERTVRGRRNGKRVARAAAAPGIGLALLFLALALVVVASIAYGSKTIGFGAVFDAVLHHTHSTNATVVRGLRIPRTLLGVAVGCALGLAGAVMQGVTRNPLADPGILGVNAGASLAVALSVFVLGVDSPLGYIWFAFGGAAAASVFVYVLGSRGRKGATPVTLALAGTATTAFLGSVTTVILLNDTAVYSTFRFWSVGSLTGRSSTILPQVLPFLTVGAILAVAAAPALNLLSLGDDAARSLGQRVGRARAMAATSVLLLVGGAVSAAGPIAFMGLVVPHIARAIVGPDYRWVMPYSAVLGAILLLGADILGRLVVRPSEIEVSIMTAVIGTPVFIALIRRSKVAEL